MGFFPGICPVTLDNTVGCDFHDVNDIYSCQSNCATIPSCNYFSMFDDTERNQKKCFHFAQCGEDCPECTTGPTTPDVGDCLSKKKTFPPSLVRHRSPEHHRRPLPRPLGRVLVRHRVPQRRLLQLLHQLHPRRRKAEEVLPLPGLRRPGGLRHLHHGAETDPMKENNFMIAFRKSYLMLDATRRLSGFMCVPNTLQAYRDQV